MNTSDIAVEFISNAEDGADNASIADSIMEEHPDLNRQSVMRAVQRVRALMMSVDEGSYLVSDGRWSIEIPNGVMEEICRLYASEGAGLTRRQVVVKLVRDHGFTMSQRDLIKVHRALQLYKSSLPLAPHEIASGDANSLAESVLEEKEALIWEKFAQKSQGFYKKRVERAVERAARLDWMSAQVAEATKDYIPKRRISPSPDWARESLELDHEVHILLSDWHVGAAWDHEFGSFGIDAAWKNLESLTEQVVEAISGMILEPSAIKVFCLGDMIDGMLPMRDGHELEQDIPGFQQPAVCAHMLAEFMSELACQHIHPREVHLVGGNHDRAGGHRKSDPMRTAAWWVADVFRALTRDMPHEVKMSKSSVSYASAPGGVNVLGLHGDKGAPKNAARPWVKRGGPVVVYSGHRHSHDYWEEDSVTCVRNGAFCGASTFAVEQCGLDGQASQTLTVVSRHGVIQTHRMVL